MKDLQNQIATILCFFTSIIQLVIIVIVLNNQTTQSRYAERQYAMMEKVIEKQQEITTQNKEQLIRIDNMLRVFHQPAQ